MTNVASGAGGLNPRDREMLQKMFTKGNQVAAQGQFDYAHDLYQTCVLKDPGNKLYTQALVGNLQKKYNNNKKGSTLASMTTLNSRAGLNSASMKKDWPNVLKNGIEILKANPWDSGALTSMANACKELGHDETEILYYECALSANLKDVELNKKYARALEAQGSLEQLEKAVTCWKRVLEAKPNDEEPRRMFRDLSVKITMVRGKFEEAETTRDVKAASDPQGISTQRQITVEDQIEKELKKDPTNVGKYLELAQLHRMKERFEDAVKVLRKALEVSGGDMNIQERLEDVEISRCKQLIETAKSAWQQEKTPERAEAYKKLNRELNNLELDVYRKRSERHTENLSYQFELGLRLERSNLAKEAIQAYQKARGDAARKGLVLYGLGRCFASIRQYQLSLNHFQEALAILSDADLETKKECMYLAGRVAMDYVKDREAAHQLFTKLASIDFGYKDVSDRLDKLSQEGQNG